jgi:hypothetical protein
MSNYQKAKLGAADIEFDSARNGASFNRPNSTGGTTSIAKFNASHLPVLASLAWGNAESVQDFLVKCKELNDAYDAFISNVGHWDKFLGFFADSATLEAEHSDPTDDDVFAWVEETKSFWHWDQSLGTPAWADSHRTLEDEATPTLGADLSTGGNDINFGDNSGIKGVQTVKYATFSENVIASGSITQSQVLTSVDTEGDAATDDLDQIVPAADCNKIEIKLEDAARIVTLKHNTGANKLSLPYDQDIIMQFGVIYQFTHDGNGWVLNGTHLDIVTQVEAEAGLSTAVKAWTPERVKQAAVSFAASIIKQIVYTEDARYISTTSSIPDDNTIPQNTEGAEYTQLATTITPLDASSNLIIEVYLPVVSSANNYATIALFEDSDTDCIGVSVGYSGGSASIVCDLSLRVIVSAGSTSARTYKLRYGSNSTGSMYIGGDSAENFSTVKKAYMTITEYEP